MRREGVNGNGYSFRIGGEDLPLGARIMAVTDVFTSLTEDRVSSIRQAAQLEAFAAYEDFGRRTAEA
jgi:HD-GYP domain-containing protein (c-di-GMP phosphodiesterase class II)